MPDLLNLLDLPTLYNYGTTRLLPTLYFYTSSSLLYLTHMMLVNVRLDVRGYKGIVFQGCRLYYTSPFLMVQLERSWQYWCSCIAENV